jgi:hypothetical protein
MIIPYKPVYFQKATRAFKHIIIHDLSCRFSGLDGAKVDTKKSSIAHLRNYNWIFNDEFDLPFHFVCEKIGQDFETIMATPLCYKCVYDDIPSEFEAAVHIAFAADYSVVKPEQRIYQQAGYRAIASVMRWFKLPFGHIYLHREVSQDKENACPGNFFDKNRLMAAIKPLILMKG